MAWEGAAELEVRVVARADRAYTIETFVVGEAVLSGADHVEKRLENVILIL